MLCTPSVSVKTDYDHAATLGKYHTYALDTSAIGLSATGSEALQSSLRSSLAGRGLKESGKNSDIYIVATVFTQEKLNVKPSGGYTVYPSQFGSYRMRTSTLNTDVQQYTRF